MYPAHKDCQRDEGIDDAVHGQDNSMPIDSQPEIRKPSENGVESGLRHIDRASEAKSPRKPTEHRPEGPVALFTWASDFWVGEYVAPRAEIRSEATRGA